MMVARTATILLGFGIFGGSGRTYLSYSLFCADGKPMYYDMAFNTYTSIANQEDVAAVVSDITENMMQLTGLSKPAQPSPSADALKPASGTTQPINQPVGAGDDVAKKNVESTELKVSAPAATESSARDDVANMEKLKNMKDRGLITEEEYNVKKKEILDRM